MGRLGMKQNKLTQEDLLKLKWRIKGRQIIGVALFWRYHVVPPFSSKFFGEKVMAQHVGDLFLWHQQVVLLLEDWAVVMMNRQQSSLFLETTRMTDKRTVAQFYLDDGHVLIFTDNRRDGHLMLLPLPKCFKKGRTVAPSL